MFIRSVGIQGMWLDTTGKGIASIHDAEIKDIDYRDPIPVKVGQSHQETLRLSPTDWPADERPPYNLRFVFVSGIMIYRGLLDTEDRVALSRPERIN